MKDEKEKAMSFRELIEEMDGSVFTRPMILDEEETARLLAFMTDERNSKATDLHIELVETDATTHEKAMQTIAEAVKKEDED